MAEDLTIPKSAEELIADMENAFRAGELGLTALAIWELTNRFPDDASVARIYTKKLMRDAEFSSLSLEVIRDNAKENRDSGDPAVAAQICAMGLLRFPGDRYLSLNLVEAAEKLGQLHWIRPALEPLGEPEEGDLILLHMWAALAHQERDYETSRAHYTRLVEAEPKNESFIGNLSAALVGLERNEDAIALLENALSFCVEPKNFVDRLTGIYRLNGDDVGSKLEVLRQEHFSVLETPEHAKTRSDISIFLQDFAEAREALAKCLQMQHFDQGEYELTELDFVLENLDSAFSSYESRFKAFPWLRYCDPPGEKYDGRILNKETLFLWAEQGLGDELMFSLFYGEVAKRVKSVTLAAEPRLIPFLKNRFPSWEFRNRHTVNDQLPNCDFSCPSGELLKLFFKHIENSPNALPDTLLSVITQRQKRIVDTQRKTEKIKIGISWRGGKSSHPNGRIRSMQLSDMLAGLPEAVDAEVICLQYDGEYEAEINDFQDRRVVNSGIDNRQDIEGVIAIVSQCAAVISIDNSVAHISCVMEKPTYVVVPAGQTQFRWKSERFRKTLFPTAKVFAQDSPGDWSTVVDKVWQAVLSDVGIAS